MRAVDTNILVRWITRDDPVQSEAADAVMKGPVLVPLTVLIELGWTLLGKTYCLSRADLAAVLSKMLQVSSISIPFEEDVRWAVERFAAGADLADMLHIVGSRGADAFLSFEHRLGTLAGEDAPVPVERLL